MGNVVPLRSKSEVRLRSAILSKLILLLLTLTLQREKFKGVNAKDWPYTTETPENIYILILFFPEGGSRWGLGNNYVEVSNLSVAVEGQSFIR